MLINLGGLHLEQGRVEEARAYHDVALGIAREVGDRRTEGIVLVGNLGVLHMDQGRLDEAAWGSRRRPGSLRRVRIAARGVESGRGTGTASLGTGTGVA